MLIAETRFAKPDGYGMLFANGTGTGKTFMALGVVKRLERQGKTNVLIAVPDDKIMADWVKSGKSLFLDITPLANTKDAGRGIVITTYANLQDNDVVAARDWDMVVADEAHKLVQNADGDPTGALRKLRAISLHPDGAYDRHQSIHAKEIARAESLVERLQDVVKKAREAEAAGAPADALNVEADSLLARSNEINAALREKRKAVEADVVARQGATRPRALFLSATPFAYVKTIDWAQGYLFDYREGYPHTETSLGYNTPNPQQYFFQIHFGYQMRTGKLNKPDAKVDSGAMERAFNGWLKKRGVLSNRTLDVDADYDRRFILAESAVGTEIDRALQWVAEQADTSKPENTLAKGFELLNADLSESLFGKTGHLTRRYLLEAIKAKEVIPHVRAHLALGRKVVVFHDFKKGGSRNPFAFPERKQMSEWKDHTAAELAEYNATVDMFNRATEAFRAEFPLLAGDVLSELQSPIERFSREFEDVLLINGSEKKSDVLARYNRFNDDAVGPIVALVQSDKNAGWSGHDTTGKHQRVLFNLGLPTQPTKTIQTEGRIYRTGQVSNAIMRYLNTGTNWERWAFAETIATRSVTVDNLASGEAARALKDAFIAGFEESGDFPAGHEGEGTGGKARDKMLDKVASLFDRAMAFYWGTQKKNSRTKAQEGADYFATPEPLGLKMVEWADIRPGEDVLEPSGGHGAIARWFPDTTNRTAIEPSMPLGSRMALVFDGKLVRDTFENLHV
ncbi:MAG: DEAD/DEAH box helicase family protein, partial [Burkholderiales bacterium]|nr:DEAD/DEAH box helicase family protein [Burkholderiales bacterium]